jgi:hypothetical protein
VFFEYQVCLVNVLQGAVYWISIGNVNAESSGDLLSHMTDLIEKLSNHSEVESDRWVQTSTTINGATERLRRYFKTEALREGLLILDDVSSPEVIAAFDVGCKILVTTNDSEVMHGVQGSYHLIKVRCFCAFTLKKTSMPKQTNTVKIV